MSSNVRQLLDNGVPVYPITEKSLVIGLQDAPFEYYIVAWDGASSPVVANIPAGVTVTYNNATYIGTLAASSTTAQYLYLVASASQPGEYDRYITTRSGSSFVWTALGSTAPVSPVIADNLTTNDSSKALSAKQGKILGEEVSELELKVTDRATSVNDADYAIRAVTSSSSLTDNPNGTRVRIVFKVNFGDILRLSTTYISGISAGIWDSPSNAVYAGGTGSLQVLINGYSTTPFEGTAQATGYLGVSFTNGSTAISDDLFSTMLASLSVFVGGTIKNDLNILQKEIDADEADITSIKGDVYATPDEISTTTNSLTPSSYVNKSGGPIEDTTQVIPAGAKLTKVKLYSTGSQNSNGKTNLYIYDNTRTLIKQIELDKIGATDTTFDISSYNIIAQEGYHYAFDRVGYKYDTSIPNGRFLIASSGNQTDTKYWFGWTFSYEVTKTKLEKFIEENADIFDDSVTIDNPLPSAIYTSYNNGQAVEDKWQNLPVGAKLTKVHCSSKGTAGSNFTFLHIYDSTRTQVGERIQLGQIGTTDTTFDISAKNIVVQEGYHYCIQYVAQIVIASNNTNSGRYYCPGNDTSPFSGYQLGFSFSYETTKDKIVNSPLTGKYASFVGDSICQGAGYQGGYPLLLEKNYGMLPPQNLGASGGIVATDENESRVYINTMVAKMDSNADFFIVEGGVNDADLNIPMGAMSEGFTAELDNTTFYGAMETMCKALVTTFAGKKVGYIAAHRVSTTTKYAYTRESASNYYEAAIKVCEKWGVPFLDLNKHCPPLGCISSLKSAYTSNGDGYHPNQDGYNKYYVDRIASWMQTL